MLCEGDGTQVVRAIPPGKYRGHLQLQKLKVQPPCMRSSSKADYSSEKNESRSLDHPPQQKLSQHVVLSWVSLYSRHLLALQAAELLMCMQDWSAQSDLHDGWIAFCDDARAPLSNSTDFMQ